MRLERHAALRIHAELARQCLVIDLKLLADRRVILIRKPQAEARAEIVVLRIRIIESVAFRAMPHQTGGDTPGILRILRRNHRLAHLRPERAGQLQSGHRACGNGLGRARRTGRHRNGGWGRCRVRTGLALCRAVRQPRAGLGQRACIAGNTCIVNRHPGLRRRFAAEHFDFVPASNWAEQRQKALAESKLDVGFEAFGYDIDPAAGALANANAKLAGVEKRCNFEVADVADFAATPEAFDLPTPPYGERMNTIEGATKLARTLGRQMAEHPCAGLYAITADMEFESHYGKRANKRRKMYNGMIPCQLYMYYEAPKFEHTAKPMPKQGFDGQRTAEFKKK